MTTPTQARQTGSWQHSAFYRFAALPDPAATAAELRALGARLGAPGRIGGSLIVASEGVNGAVAGVRGAVAAFESALRLDPSFAALHGIVFKHSACDTPAYGRFSVSLKPALVAISLDEGAPPGDQFGTLGAADWNALITRPDVLLLDNRNHWEFRLGRFRGAADPGVDLFSDFADRVREQAPAWRAAGTTVAMYCTGGIRCDRTAPWMRETLGLTVHTLRGGILGYLAEQAAQGRPGGLWDGDCYVFDRRVALDARLQPTGRRPETVYDPARPDEAWRLQRALRLGDAGPAVGPAAATLPATPR
ncbi:MAG: hypothetical protein RIQ60_1543 [Pseudomonadota bacterium]|jgi:UPF0176 protein